MLDEFEAVDYDILDKDGYMDDPFGKTRRAAQRREAEQMLAKEPGIMLSDETYKSLKDRYGEYSWLELHEKAEKEKEPMGILIAALFILPFLNDTAVLIILDIIYILVICKNDYDMDRFKRARFVRERIGDDINIKPKTKIVKENGVKREVLVIKDEDIEVIPPDRNKHIM